MSNEANRQLVTEFFARLSSTNPLAAVDLMADSCTWWTAGDFPLSGTRGKDELADVFGPMAEILSGTLRLEPKSFIIEGDRLAVEAESHAERKDGRLYNNKYHFVIEVLDGKIAAIREYSDTLQANEFFFN